MTENTTPDLDRHSPDYEFRPFPGNTPPAPKKQAWWKKPIVILPVATLILGLGLGMSNRPDPVTNTVTVEKPVEKIVEKEVTPQACLTALDKAGEVIDISGEVVRVMSEGFSAVSTMDVAGVAAVGPKVQEQTAKLKALTPSYVAAKTECRAAGL